MIEKNLQALNQMNCIIDQAGVSCYRRRAHPERLIGNIPENNV